MYIGMLLNIMLVAFPGGLRRSFACFGSPREKILEFNCPLNDAVDGCLKINHSDVLNSMSGSK